MISFLKRSPSNKFVVATGGIYCLGAFQFMLERPDAHPFVALALLLLGISTWIYHYFDTQDAAIFDHFSMIFLFLAIGMNHEGLFSNSSTLAVLFVLLMLSMLTSAIKKDYYIPVVGASFLYALVSSYDAHGDLVRSIALLGGFAGAFLLQQFAEQFKYTETDRFNWLHGSWHIVAYPLIMLLAL